MKRSVINAFLLVLFWFEFSFKTSKSFTILRCPCGHFFFFFLLRAFIPMSYFLLPREFLFCRKLSSFVMTSYFSAASIFLLPWFFFLFCYELFSFAMTFSFLPWEFFFRHEHFTFAANFLLFASSIFLLPQAFFLCRALFYFAESFTPFPWHLWATVVSTLST